MCVCPATFLSLLACFNIAHQLSQRLFRLPEDNDDYQLCTCFCEIYFLPWTSTSLNGVVSLGSATYSTLTHLPTVVRDQFNKSWNHPERSAQLQAIYAVLPDGKDPSFRRFAHCYPSYMGHRFEMFMSHMESTIAEWVAPCHVCLRVEKIPIANIRSSYREGSMEPYLRFHGTRRACLIGEQDPGDGNWLWTCRSPECSLCKILRNSFTLATGSKWHAP